MTVSRQVIASLVIAASALAVVLLGATGAFVSQKEPSSLPPMSMVLPSMAGAAISDPTIGMRSAAMSQSPAASLSGSAYAPDIDGISCEPLERVAYHVHAHLTIRIRGERHIVPSQIGFRGSCLYWLHTHAASGVIHIEAPTRREFALGQFFDIWGKPLDRTHVGSSTTELGERVYAFVDGAAWTADPRDITLGARTVIELQVGAEPLPPLEYVFPAGL